ncbi:MAG: hypothetical protein FWJ62_07620 [Thermaerobacter sp.]|nr:hypothetical protein [Bacillota bacterium]
MLRMHRRSHRQGLATLTLVLAAALAFAAPAAAHILNEKSQFADIEFVDARFDIVMLSGAGIIPQAPVFLPDDPLTLKDLAAWAALAHRLGEGGETPDVDALAQAALSQGLVASLDGEATYADVNRLLFDGAVTLPADQAAAVPTRAEAAAFVARHLFSDAGQALLERLSLRAGPAGVVEAVTAHEDGGHHHGSRYSFTFGSGSYPVDAHARVGNGPTDLLQWEGLYVVRSLLKGDGDEAVLVYVEAGEPGAEAVAEEPAGSSAPSGESGEQAQTVQPAPDAPDTSQDGTAAGDQGGSGAAAPEASPGTGSGPWLWVLLAAIVILGAFLFAGGRRRS